MPYDGHLRRDVAPGHPEKVIALVAGEPQRPGERRQRLFAGLWATTLF